MDTIVYPAEAEDCDGATEDCADEALGCDWAVLDGGVFDWEAAGAELALDGAGLDILLGALLLGMGTLLTGGEDGITKGFMPNSAATAAGEAVLSAVMTLPLISPNIVENKTPCASICKVCR